NQQAGQGATSGSLAGCGAAGPDDAAGSGGSGGGDLVELCYECWRTACDPEEQACEIAPLCRGAMDTLDECLAVIDGPDNAGGSPSGDAGAPSFNGATSYDECVALAVAQANDNSTGAAG